MKAVRHVAEGCLFAGKGALEVRTIVSGGYAIALEHAGAGALLHLSRGAGTQANDDVADESWFAPAVSRLLEAWRRLCPAGDPSQAEIVGGADVLRILAPRLRERLAAQRATAIAARLRRDGIVVRRSRVGGPEARHVALVLPEGRVEVTTATGRLLTRPAAGRAAGGESIVRSRADRPVDDGRGLTTIVDMGCMHVDRAPHRLTAVLGSCVGVALFDPSTRIGGLAHVVLPRHPGAGNSHALAMLEAPRARYADTAVPALLEALVGAGARRESVCAKIAGGANALFASCGESAWHVADKNVAETRLALAKAGVPLLAESIGGRAGRRVVVDLSDFGVQVRLLGGRGKA